MTAGTCDYCHEPLPEKRRSTMRFCPDGPDGRGCRKKAWEAARSASFPCVDGCGRLVRTEGGRCSACTMRDATAERRERVIELVKQGKTYGEIARDVGMASAESVGVKVQRLRRAGELDAA